MCVCARLLLLAALPALAGIAGGEVVSVEGADGPTFPPRAPPALVAAVGQDAALACRVLRLGDKSVSWVRSRDLQILCHAGEAFTADARVSCGESRSPSPGSPSAAATLRIQRLRLADAGRYECQLNTEPKMSLFYNLTVVDEPVPAVEVVAEERAVRGAAGGAASLACEARYRPAPRLLPAPPLHVRWERLGDAAPRDLQDREGGVSLETERWDARVVSRVRLAGLRSGDAGQYRCAAGGHADTVTLLLAGTEEHMEMQRDQSASGAGRAPLWPALTLLPALMVHPTVALFPALTLLPALILLLAL